MASPPPSIRGAALMAFLIAAYDVVDTILAALRPGGTGRIVGTLVRDALLVLGGVLLLRRVVWSAWLLGALFALSLLRVLVPSGILDAVVNAFALAGIVLLLLPRSYAWLRRR